MAHFGDTCVALRKQGLSLAEIVQKTGRPKTSVYEHIRHIPLPRARVLAYRKKNAEHLRTLGRARRGKAERSFTPFTFTEDTVRLVAHLMFDGEIKYRGCGYNNRNMVLVREVERLMRSIYDHKPKKYLYKPTGVHRIWYFNVALGDYLIHKASELVTRIPTMKLAYKRTFLQAFFDDEGCAYFRKSASARAVRGYQKNTKILALIQTLLVDFSIPSTLIPPNEIVITGKDNLLRFQKEIGFSKGVRINGRRSNSIWKQSLEKREILRRAIESFT